MVGVAITVILVAATEFFTGAQFWPVQAIARASRTGHATNIIAGQAIGMQGTAIPVLTIAIGILVSYPGRPVRHRDRRHGDALDDRDHRRHRSYGPITDNAGGVAEMADLPKGAAVTDPLDAVGNTTKAVTKGYAIGSAGLAALVLFASYTDVVNNKLSAAAPAVSFNLTDQGHRRPVLGGILPFLFGSLRDARRGHGGRRGRGQGAPPVQGDPRHHGGDGQARVRQCVDIVTTAALKRDDRSRPAPGARSDPGRLLFGPEALGGHVASASSWSASSWPSP